MRLQEVVDERHAHTAGFVGLLATAVCGNKYYDWWNFRLWPFGIALTLCGCLFLLSVFGKHVPLRVKLVSVSALAGASCCLTIFSAIDRAGHVKDIGDACLFAIVTVVAIVFVHRGLKHLKTAEV